MSRVDVDAPTETSADGRARRWDSHRAARRTELTLAARRAVHHGGPDLSMDDIAAAIGTSKSIVYRYFSDRAGLQRAVGEAVLHDLGTALAEASREAATPEGALRAMVAVYLEMVAASPSVYVFVTGGAAIEAGDDEAPMRVLAHDAATLLVPSLADVLAATGRPVDLAPVWAAGVIGFVRGAADLVLARRPVDLTSFADAIADWLCHGTSQLPSAAPS
ncbi:TetR family transcriptional regulator [Salana multivorans]|uniref:TetR family transcriptional regulator n=1 Tax=Salana multivorans TaxID=120377 RepID=A0A3N2DBQ5_9MICO|nr:TetR/AcrR family transcriptional regulator [Salana multivorans]OJX96056.1 MAG: hypothetical protein BGO96_07145 [Micrococcales bacterium 73-15]ROR97088.1 TetR family transcriptional regulator [Salana multivorans]